MAERNIAPQIASGHVHAAPRGCSRRGFILLLAGVGGCQPSDVAPAPDARQQEAVALHQDVLEEVANAPERILSLIPAVTELLVELGAEGRIVGRTDYDTASAVRALPSVGGGIGPSLERVLELRPDLVIRFAGPSDAATGARLDDAGIRHVAVRLDRIEDLLAIVTLMGRELENPQGAANLRSRLEGELEGVRTRVAGRPRVRVVYLLGGDPPLVASAGTFLHELLEIAGAENLLATAGPLYAPVSVEAILALAPDLILASEGSRIPVGLRGIPLRTTPTWLEIPGAHLGRGAARLADLLHPASALEGAL